MQNDPFTNTPPGFGRTADGRLVAVQSAASVGTNPNARRKFLLVFQYWRGDLERIDKLANLVADIERVFNPDVDILLFGRKDCKPATLQYGTIENLKRKFETVHLADDAGNYGNGFPWGANDMWQDLVARMATPRWTSKYRCFLNLEWDCCPLRPGWLTELGREFDYASNEGLSVIGALQIDPTPHINGVAVYATDINTRVKGGLDGGCPPDAAYDIMQREKIMPLARNTPLMKLDYRRPTISPEELLSLPAVFLHGVRDESAIAAVRAEHIDHVPRNQQTFARSTVFTYHRKISGVDEREIDDQIALWKRGWLSAGWNPVVLNSQVAEHHPLYAEVMARVASFPTTGNVEHANVKFERWLALAQQGGGMMSEFDVLPSTAFTPNAAPEKDGFQPLCMKSACLVQATKEGINSFILAVMAYEPDGKTTNVTELDVIAPKVAKEATEIDPKAPKLVCRDMVKERGEADWRTAKAVHFHQSAILASMPGYSPSRAMIAYLRGE